MRTASITIDKAYKKAEVDPRIYGSFIEHLGRAVYEGIYQPGSPLADEQGFRKDVLELVRELQVPVIRYPGGNFVSGFRWEDSVGPVSERPVRRDLAWKTTETNAFGLDEFYHWTQKAGSRVMMAVNMGTRGIQDAVNLLEYCNAETGSYYSDLRASHGRKDPYGIKLWCIGNEMDGPWQIGHKTAEEYGRLSEETAKAMKLLDPTIECVSCGSSFLDMPTFGSWEAETLMHNYDYIDYLSLHQYYGDDTGDSNDFLARSDDMAELIRSVASICDYVKARKRSKKTISLSFDEWNVWYHSKEAESEFYEREPWSRAPHLLEEAYDFQDALLTGEMMITLLQHADRVKIACLAQLVNVLAPIMTSDTGVYRQTIYFPFLYASRYARGTVLETPVTCGVHDTKSHGEVSDLVSVTTWNEEAEKLTILAVNRNLTEDIQLSVDLRDFPGYQVTEHVYMHSEDLHAGNTEGKEQIHPETAQDWTLDEHRLSIPLGHASWNMIRLKRS